MLKTRILLIAPDSRAVAPFRSILEDSGYWVSLNRIPADPARKPIQERFDLVVSFWETRDPIEERSRMVDALFLLGEASVARTVCAFQNGIYRFRICKEDTDHFLQTVRMLLKNAPTNKKLQKYSEKTVTIADLIGRSPQMASVRKLIQSISRHPDMPVLITGETGTGKELAADILHQTSSRACKPFIKINCSAIPETLLESQLYGHKRGAFTGAVDDQIGMFEQADGGTILLDEIGEMNPRLQPKLLRFLESQIFHRVGDNRSIQVDVWILASTNASLMDMMKNGLFRKDLYYRLNPVKMEMPPLREHQQDIPLLIQDFSIKYGFRPEVFHSETMRRFTEYDWPGNVRELKNVVCWLLRNSKSGMVKPEDLPPEIKIRRSAQELDTEKSAISLEEVEKRHILKVFLENGKKIRTAARILGIDRKTLRKKLEKYKVQWSIHRRGELFPMFK